MAAAQVLRVANTVDDKVQGIANNVVSVDDRVAGVDNRMNDVHDQVKAVDDKVAAIIDGAQHIFNQSSKNVQYIMCLGGNEARLVMQQAAEDVDQMKGL